MNHLATDDDVGPSGHPGDGAPYWAERISIAWSRTALAIIQTGELLIEAKEALQHGEWIDVLHQVKFDESKAQRLMSIARDQRLSNPAILPLLPDRWTQVHKLHKIKDAEKFERKLVELNADKTALKKERRESREMVLGGLQMAMPTKRYGVILADPEWRFEVYSRETGMDRAADNHYPTSATDVIASRPVETIAAADCCLFLWATVPMLPDALRVMEAWGFTYKSHFIWNKDKIGTGYWNRNKHELLLVGTRGNIPAPAMGEQAHSVVDAPVRLHSEKPAAFYLLIESYFPTLPKIELNARRARAGWDSWGNEAPEQAA